MGVAPSLWPAPVSGWLRLLRRQHRRLLPEAVASSPQNRAKERQVVSLALLAKSPFRLCTGPAYRSSHTRRDRVAHKSFARGRASLVTLAYPGQFSYSATLRIPP